MWIIARFSVWKVLTKIVQPCQKGSSKFSLQDCTLEEHFIFIFNNLINVNEIIFDKLTENTKNHNFKGN